MLRTPHLRPEFEFIFRGNADEVAARVRAMLREQPDRVGGLFAPGRIELVPARSEQHLWSPQLTADLTPLEEGGSTHIHVRFGPHPHVWSMYLAMHAIGAIGTLGAGVFGYSQYLVGQTPWALWALPAAPALAALVWALAFVGQSMSAEQMYELRRFLERALE